MDIRLVISDVDGSLTDGSVIYSSDGTTSRVFSTFDGEGFAILREHGIGVLLVTQSDSPEIKNRADWLGVPIVMGVTDKGHLVRYILEDLVTEFDGAGLESTCFFGNDVSDIGAMKLVGLPACPADAHWSVLDYVEKNGWITKEKGGMGAFRRLVDILIPNYPKNLNTQS